jgi:hypothetical protein
MLREAPGAGTPRLAWGQPREIEGGKMPVVRGFSQFEPPLPALWP